MPHAPLLASVLLLLPTTAVAADLPNTPESTRESFYGWQNILVSHAAVGLVAAGLARRPTVAVAGLTLYVVGSPVVHALHGGGIGRIGASLAINVLVPTFLATIGHEADRGCFGEDTSCTPSYSANLTLVGLVLAPILDGLVLGWKKEATPKVTLVPTVRWAAKGDRGSATTFGVAGEF